MKWKSLKVISEILIKMPSIVHIELSVYINVTNITVLKQYCKHSIKHNIKHSMYLNKQKSVPSKSLSR